ncbi:hypothetical protein PI124_g17790 [Phytophthora idaei]|nr:hypothetical protein PI125_g22144 [Phytophthora idaei]KAG3130679.1 hypothetical protein PI126_g20394 [Phytophthora idaei]KAG3237217.1 hypothetical protein PI124_g17790 [Phytophthora idaei]
MSAVASGTRNARSQVTAETSSAAFANAGHSYRLDFAPTLPFHPRRSPLFSALFREKSHWSE